MQGIEFAMFQWFRVRYGIIGHAVVLDMNGELFSESSSLQLGQIHTRAVSETGRGTQLVCPLRSKAQLISYELILSYIILLWGNLFSTLIIQPFSKLP